jgi:hypothetical protein
MQMSIDSEIHIMVEVSEQETTIDAARSRDPSVEPSLFCINRRDCALKYLQTMVKKEADRRGGSLDSPTFIHIFKRQVPPLFSFIKLIYCSIHLKTNGNLMENKKKT